MRVIHGIVKTEETQKLRMKFCIVLHYLSFKHKKYTLPSVNRSISPPLDSRHEDCGAEGH